MSRTEVLQQIQYVMFNVVIVMLHDEIQTSKIGDQWPQGGTRGRRGWGAWSPHNARHWPEEVSSEWHSPLVTGFDRIAVPHGIISKIFNSSEAAVADFWCKLFNTKD